MLLTSAIDSRLNFSGKTLPWARYYDSSIGRFLEVDPDLGKISTPLTFVNKYIYGLNSPLDRIDPSGRISFKQIAGLAFVCANPMIGLVLINTAFGQKMFDFSKRDVSRINKTAITIGAIGATVASGGSLGLTVGLVVGAGIFNASISSEGQFLDNFLNGAMTAAISSAVFGSYGKWIEDAQYATNLSRIVSVLSVAQNPDFQNSMDNLIGKGHGDILPGV